VQMESNAVLQSSQAQLENGLNWTAAQVAELLADETPTPTEHITALLRCLNERQSADEQESGFTIHQNGIGFNRLDAELLSSIAKWSADHGGYLTPKQEFCVRKRLRKYSRQLAEALNTGEVVLPFVLRLVRRSA
jgi:hypothetical protein